MHKGGRRYKEKKTKQKNRGDDKSEKTEERTKKKQE
jgi:hypothetical protein